MSATTSETASVCAGVHSLATKGTTSGGATGNTSDNNNGNRVVGKKRKISFRSNLVKPKKKPATSASSAHLKDPPQATTREKVVASREEIKQTNTSAVPVEQRQDFDENDEDIDETQTQKIMTQSQKAATMLRKKKANNRKDKHENANTKQDTSESNVVEASISNNNNALVPAVEATPIADDMTVSGQPRLKAFCSSFKSKPNRRIAAAAAAAPRAAPSVANNNYNDQDEDNIVPAGPAVMEVDGEIVLLKSSLVVHGNKTVHQQSNEEDREVVEEDDTLGIIKSSSNAYRKKGKAPSHWNAADTKTFYQALRQVGMDFGTMEALYFNQTRSRRNLKKKFQMESNKNPKLIEAALNPKARQKLDLERFDVVVDKEALEKSRQEREEAYEKTKQAHEARQQKEEQERSQHNTENAGDKGDTQVVGEDTAAADAAIPPASRSVGQNKAYFDDTKLFWQEAAQEQRISQNDALDPLLAGGDGNDVDDNDAVNRESLSNQSVGGSISLVSSNSKKKKKKPSFRLKKKGK